MTSEQILGGAIIRILPVRKSRNGNNYQRIIFKLEDKRVAFTDLCEQYMNYGRWKPLLVIGKELKSLRVSIMGKTLKVNADSFPEEIRAAGPEMKFIKLDNRTVSMVPVERTKPKPKEEIVQLSLFSSPMRPSQSDVFANS